MAKPKAGDLTKFGYGGAANLPVGFDWKKPDYAPIIRQRADSLRWIRENPQQLPALKAYYRDNPADFINDWGFTFDPRNADVGLPTTVPFVLFPKQREWINWVIDRWKNRRPGLNEKSRECGVTWLAVALSCTLCLFHDGIVIGFGSRKSDYVDKIGTMKPILPKGRMFMDYLPREFTGAYESWRDAPYMRIGFPDTGSIITGEAGDDIGRGDRTTIFFVDEAAAIPRPELVDAALSQTTNCRIDMSSVRGMNNSFARKRWGGKIEVFIFDWHDDPRKDQAWYDKQCEDLDAVVVAQEIDRDYAASVHGIVIPGKWVRAAIDAKEKLGIAPSGMRGGSLDVADEGADKNAFGQFFGTTIETTQDWSGKGADIFATVETAFEICDEQGYEWFLYDADGLGAGVRGDARVINERRKVSNQKHIEVRMFRGSGEVFKPDEMVDGTIGREGDKGRTNKDYFANAKAQGWWALRKRFQRTHRWVVDGVRCAPDDIISISSKCPNYLRLVAELSQVTYSQNGAGKLVINKKPDGMPSPNLADTVMTWYAPKDPPAVRFTAGMLAQLGRGARPR